MREEVFQVHKYLAGYRVDKQLLICLEEIFKEYSDVLYLKICSECANSTKYTFSTIDECFNYFEKTPYRIVAMVVEATLKKEHHCNKITITFDNTVYIRTEIVYQFENNDAYLLVKDKIERCMKNFKLNYHIISVLPFMRMISFLGLATLCTYMEYIGVDVPDRMERMMVYMWMFGCVIFDFLTPLTRLKRDIFPHTEFRVGQNELIEKRNEKIRNVILYTVIGSTILAVLQNFIIEAMF